MLIRPFSIKITKTPHTLFDIYMSLMLLMPLTSLFIDSVNKLLFFVIFFFQMLIICRRLTARYLCMFTVAIITYAIALLNTDNLTFSNMIVYYMNWILFSGLIVINKDTFINWIRNNEKIISLVMIIWTVSVALSVLLPSSYYVKEGGGRYFGSFAGSTFRLAPLALMIQTLALVAMVFYKNKKYIVHMIMPLFTGFMGGSRTYLLLILVELVIAVFVLSKKAGTFMIKMIPVVIAGYFVYQRTSISIKVAQTLDTSAYGDFWFRITSSRSQIWGNLLKEINKLPLFEKIFGAGFQFSNSVADGHYAHNDFLEILATHGIIGLVLYILSIVFLIRAFYKNEKIHFILGFSCVFVWLFNAMFNMFYNYTCAVFAFPFLLAAAVEFARQKRIQSSVQNHKENNEEG